MSYAIYNTEAVVLKRVEHGEADVLLWMITKDLGLIIAKAQGVRKLEAKMRGYLQLFKYCRVSLVRGKCMWRVTGAEMSSNMTPQTIKDRNLLNRLSTFICRITPLESNTVCEIFELMVNLIKNDINVDNIDKYELVLVAKILVNLGYLDELKVDEFYKGLITRYDLATDVNNAISNSHL